MSLGLPVLLSASSARYTPAVVTFPGQAAEGLSAVQRVVDAVLDTAVDVAREKLLVYHKDCGSQQVLPWIYWRHSFCLIKHCCTSSA